MSATKRSTLSAFHLHLIGGVTLVALTVLGYVIVVRPVAQERQTLSSLRARIVEAEQAANRARATGERLGRDLAVVETALAESRVRLETVDHLNKRLAVIVTVATESGLVIHETRSGEVQPGLRFDTVPIVLAGSGPYPNCADFLHRLYQQLPDVEVVGFELTGNPGTPGTPSMFQFRLAWYAATRVVAKTPAPGDGSGSGSVTR